ncbi:MAG: hypothetical protein U0U70_01900 [Chitinophagaceae bacterium]
MKQLIKQGTGLYTYLSDTGVLHTGNDEAIKQAKQEYWRQYRKQWKKNKRQQSKKYVLLFSFQEARVITKKAVARQLRPAQYIKQTALTGNDVIGTVLKGRIREQVLLFCFILDSLTETHQLEDTIKNEIIESATRLEEAILNALEET